MCIRCVFEGFRLLVLLPMGRVCVGGGWKASLVLGILIAIQTSTTALDVTIFFFFFFSDLDKYELMDL